MPASNLLAEAVAAIVGNTDADDRVHVGSRLQSGTLPAVVVEQLSSERATIGASGTGRVRHQWKLNAIADDMVEARNVANAAADYAIFNMTAGGHPTYRISEALVEEPQSGEGDEQEPATASLTLETFFTE